jgi:hypothetical protein
VSSRLRIRKRTPSGASSEKPEPRPGTTSTVRCVCFQSSNCDFDIQNVTGSSTPSIFSDSSSTSDEPVRNSPST